MGAARKFRYVQEDADESGYIYAAEPKDALDHAVAAESLWPMWWCDPCGTRNEGPRWTCCMCGRVREDADELSQ